VARRAAGAKGGNLLTLQRELRGRYHLLRDTTDGLHKALAHFERAIELDAYYALAFTGLADTLASLGNGGFRPMREAYLLARDAALKALAIDEQLGEAHSSLAVVATEYYWEWDDADRHYKRAIELNPNDEAALRHYSLHLACMRHILLGRVYVAQGMLDRAVGELERAHGPRPDVITPHAYVLARAARQLEARAMLDELRRISKPRDPAPIRIAFLHIGLGETDRAFEWLERAIDARDWQVALLNIEPALDTLRSDQRFAALVERVALPQRAHVPR
jgi:tetratricopeptide (TPR) repeat protein